MLDLNSANQRSPERFVLNLGEKRLSLCHVVVNVGLELPMREIKSTREAKAIIQRNRNPKDQTWSRELWTLLNHSF